MEGMEGILGIWTEPSIEIAAPEAATKRAVAVKAVVSDKMLAFEPLPLKREKAAYSAF